MSESTMQLSRGRTPGVALRDNAERNEFIVSMFLSGYTAHTILKNVNKLAQENGWGGMATERSVKRIISEHYQGRPMSAAEAKAYDFSRREAALAQQQQLYEDLSRHLRERQKAGDLAPYEYQYTKRVMANILQKNIENNGWNASKKNCGRFTTAKTQVEIYDECRESLLTPEGEASRKQVMELIDSYLDDSTN